MIDLNDPAERDALAGEYVLGTLDASEHAAVVAALPSDAALRAAVYAWQDRLLALSARAAPVTPGATLWHRIDAALRPHTPAATPATAPQWPWWRRLGLWQGVSALALAASLVLSALLWLQAPLPAGARYVAVLQSPDHQRTGWVVEMQAGGALRLVPVGAPGDVPAGRAWQFWTKPEGAAGPTSLGLVPPGRILELPTSRLPAVEAGQLFEITLEPAGGSTVGRPTGPILFVGRTVAL